MILDANTVATGATLECDICIVGAGAAGIAIALQFVKSPLRVLVLESGCELDDQPTQALYEAEIVNPDLHAPGDKYRVRRFGGSTNIWGGRCVPFDPLDFADRPWITEKNWPIGFDDLARYYPEANALCEAGESVYSAAKAVPGGMKPMIEGFLPEHFSSDGIERFSCPTNFAARYRHRLVASENVQILLNANCTEILTNAEGQSVTFLEVRTLAGVAFRVAAREFILATGGLEVPRLLLASRRNHPAGLGNANGLVGRYYMCHIAGTLGALTLDIPGSDVAPGYEVAQDGTYCRRRLALTEAAQAELGVASTVVRLHFPSIPNPVHRTGALSALYLAKPFISYEYAKRLTGEGTGSFSIWLRHVFNVVSDPFGTAGFLLHWLRKRTLSVRKFPSVIVRPRTNVFSLDYHAEQQPNFDSHVSLSAETDALGMPKLKIDWRYTALDVRTASETLRVLKEDLAAWGHGQLTYNPDEIERQMTRDGAYGGHHIGTARMSADPSSGVVDGDCLVYGLRNLYVASSAVFATSSQANPTLTIVALALRLADHLKLRFGTVGAV